MAMPLVPVTAVELPTATALVALTVLLLPSTEEPAALAVLATVLFEPITCTPSPQPVWLVPLMVLLSP